MTINEMNPNSTATQRFFWWLAGANIPLLEQCRSEWHKFTAIGCFVLVVGVLAVISGTFFLMGSLHLPIAIAIVGGLLWGFGVIIPLDRVLLTHFHKGNGAFIRTLPRLTLALMIALVINHPLLLTIFSGEIEARLHDNKAGKLQSVRTSSDKQSAVNRLTDQIAKLEGRLTKLQDVRDSAKIDMENERSGIQSNSTTGRIGEGNRFEIKKRVFDSAEKDLEAARPEIEADLTAKRDELKTFVDGIENEVNATDVVETKAAGMLNRNKALMSILKEEPDTALFALCLFLLLLSVETLPITQKLWSRKGKYDFMLDEETKFAEDETAHSYALKRRTMERRGKAENTLMDRVVGAAESGEFDLSNTQEHDFSKLIHMDILRRQAKGFGGNKSSASGTANGTPIFLEVVDYRHLTAQLVLPTQMEDSMTFEDLSPQIEAFSKEVAADLGPNMRFIEATNSAGDDIDQHFLPLLSQLKEDRKLLMKFESHTTQTDTNI